MILWRYYDLTSNQETKTAFPKLWLDQIWWNFFNPKNLSHMEWSHPQKNRKQIQRYISKEYQKIKDFCHHFFVVTPLRCCFALPWATVSKVPSQRAMQKLSLAHDGIARQLHQQERLLVSTSRTDPMERAKEVAGILPVDRDIVRTNLMYIHIIYTVYKFVFIYTLSHIYRYSLYMTLSSFSYRRITAWPQELELLELRRSNESAEKRMKLMEEEGCFFFFFQLKIKTCFL